MKRTFLWSLHQNCDSPNIGNKWFNIWFIARFKSIISRFWQSWFLQPMSQTRAQNSLKNHYFFSVGRIFDSPRFSIERSQCCFISIFKVKLRTSYRFEFSPQDFNWRLYFFLYKRICFKEIYNETCFGTLIVWRRLRTVLQIKILKLLKVFFDILSLDSFSQGLNWKQTICTDVFI